MTLSSPRQKTVKRLFAVSGNLCYFPNCGTPLVDEESGTVTGEICHIKGKKQGSPRYDPKQSDEEIHSFDNLLLMCPLHHKVIDDDPNSYKISRLEDIKKSHEQSNIGVEEPNDNITNLFILKVTDNQLKYLFPNEELDFNQIIRMIIVYNEDLRMNYRLDEPEGIKQQYGSFLANLPEETKLKLLENRDKIDSFLLEISPYLILRDIAYFFQRGWNIKINDLNKDMQHRVEILEDLENKQLKIEDISLLNGDSYIDEINFDLKKYLNWISIPNFKIPKDLVISITCNNKTEVILNLKHPNFNFKILFKATTGGLYLITKHPQYTYLSEMLSDYNFKEIRIELEVNFVLDNIYNNLFDSYISYTRNLRQLIEERFSYEYFLSQQTTSIQYVLLKKLEEIIDIVKKKERLKRFVRKFFSRKNKKIDFF